MKARSSSRSAHLALAASFAALALTLPFAPAAVAQAQAQNAAVLPAAPATHAARLEAARAEYEIGHYAVAFAAFAQLADEGHCEAARTARQMLRYGRELYAMQFAATPARLARWRELPACAAALARR